jgi:hypothetical protein
VPNVPCTYISHHLYPAHAHTTTQDTQDTPWGPDNARSTLDALGSLLPGVALLATRAELRPGYSPRSLRAVEACLGILCISDTQGESGRERAREHERTHKIFSREPAAYLDRVSLECQHACMRAGGSGAGSTRRAGGAIPAGRSSGAAPALPTLGADRSRDAWCNSSSGRAWRGANVSHLRERETVALRGVKKMSQVSDMGSTGLSCRGREGMFRTETRATDTCCTSTRAAASIHTAAIKLFTAAITHTHLACPGSPGGLGAQCNRQAP